MIRRYLGLHLQSLVDALRRFGRQPFATLLTALVIAIAIALPVGLRVLVNNVGSLSGSWQSAADFTVYFKREVPTERARALSREVAARADVVSVQFIDRAAALKEFRARSGFGAALAEARFALTGLSLRGSGALLGGGALLGWAGALLATARHLRAVEPR